MTRKWLLGLTIAALLASFTVPAIAQESMVKGNLAGTIYDTSGAVVPGAKVTISGPIGTKSMDSDERGDFSFTLLIPGFYSVKVEKEGFKVADVKSVEVYTNRTSSIRVTLEPGAVTQVVEVSVPAVTVDTSSTGIGANLADSFYHQVPVTRGLAGLFYLSAGVASGGGSGASNPSVSGGSGLENLYVADGVNITDSSFGGLGVFSRVFGSLGTGINLSFVKEVQVKTGGYEPQYGKATGGIVQIVTKSGGRDYHGVLAGYATPQQFEATRLHPDDFGRLNLTGKTLNLANYDVSGEFGGYVPGMRDNLFFFGSFNPAWQNEFVLSPPNSGLFARGERTLRTRTWSYAFKGTVKASDKHQFEASIFGDPAKTNNSTWRTLNIDNDTANSALDYGTRNLAARWNGTMSPTWLANASFTWSHNQFTETPAFNLHQITDRLQTAGFPGQRGTFTAVGVGFMENTIGDTYGFNVDTSKQFHFGGDHTFNIGYRLERPFYDGTRTRSGPPYNVPATNATGVDITTIGADPSYIGASATPGFSLRLVNSSNPADADTVCPLCPRMTIPGYSGLKAVYLRGDRNDVFFPSKFETESTYHAVYAMDSWSPNRYVTMNLGLRWEQQHMKGGQANYTFTDNWSPRIGIIADPWGNRKTKVYANFGRYDYFIPLDMALRSLTNEQSLLGVRFAPEFTVDASGRRIAVINSFGTVNPVLDAAHLLNGATGGFPTVGLFSLGQSTTAIAKGTKMEYVDEFVVGIEREFKGGVIVSGRYIDRRMKRIVEDMSGISPEAAFANVSQVYLIGNVGKNTDLFTNPIPHLFTPTFDANGNVDNAPVPCRTNPADPFSAPFVNGDVFDTFGNTIPPGGVCYEPLGVNGVDPGLDVPDGVPDGFPQPSRIYQAVEIEVNKSFSHNWQMRANWRIAKLFGNFEGAFRNDNGQTDPSISSLFDFTPGDFGLLGDQFKPGVLNTDRRHIVNFYSSYVLDRSMLKGLTLGVGVRLETGVPINDLKAHPAYFNSGEVPVGGRGALGRMPTTGSVDVHADYPLRITERLRLRLGMDLFNLANSRRQRGIDENEDISFGTKNLDFLKPAGRRTGFQRPFYSRLMVRFEF